MTSQSQLPEELRKVAREAAVQRLSQPALNGGQHWDSDVEGAPEWIAVMAANAVLAALFDACEVREEWGVRSGEYDLFSSYTRKEVERVIAEEAADGNDSCQMIRRCVLSTPAEPVSSTAEFYEDDEGPAAVAAAFEAGEKGLTRRPEADVLREAAPGLVDRAAAAARRMAGDNSTSAAIMASIVSSALWQALGCTCSDHTDEGAVYIEDLTCPMHGTVAEVSVQRGAPDD